MAVYTDATSGGAITFRLLMSAPGIDADTATDTRHIPGGDNNFIDQGGRTVDQWESEALFSSVADFNTMRRFAGGQGTLEYVEDLASPDLITLPIVLKRVQRTKVTGRGSSFAKLSLILLPS